MYRIEVYINGQYNRTHRFSNKNLAITLTQFINQGKYTGFTKRALLVY